MRYTETDEHLPVTAIHEAGHITGAWLAGIPVAHAGLVPTEYKERGHVWAVPRTRYTLHSRHLASAVSCDDDSAMVMILGGIVAEKVFDLGGVQSRAVGASGDLQKARECAIAASPAGADPQQRVSAIRVAVERVFRLPDIRAGINEIAEILLYYRALDEHALEYWCRKHLPADWTPKPFPLPSDYELFDQTRY